MVKESLSTPLISVCTTVYNSRNTVEKSLESIAAALHDFDYEIVVVDNFSTDGTYEIILELSKRYPIRIFRYRCSRGLGRSIAVRLSRGRYLMYADLDCLYYGDALKRMLSGYLRSSYKDSKCIGLLCPKQILEKNNFRDLNRTEDIDLYTRLLQKNLVIKLFIKGRLKSEIRPKESAIIKSLSSFVITTSSEARYVKGAFNHIKREMRNKLDLVTGGAITLPKFVREDLYVYRKWRHTKLLVILLRSFAILPFILLCRFLGRQIYEGDPNLSNHMYVIYKSIKVAVDPTEMGFKKSDVAAPPLDAAIRYIARLKPDILPNILRFHEATRTDD